MADYLVIRTIVSLGVVRISPPRQELPRPGNRSAAAGTYSGSGDPVKEIWQRVRALQSQEIDEGAGALFPHLWNRTPNTRGLTPTDPRSTARSNAETAPLTPEGACACPSPSEPDRAAPTRTGSATKITTGDPYRHQRQPLISRWQPPWDLKLQQADELFTAAPDRGHAAEPSPLLTDRPAGPRHRSGFLTSVIFLKPAVGSWDWN